MNNQAEFNNSPEADDEISLWDIVKFFKEGWRWLAGGLVLGLVCALGFLGVAQRQFEATAVIQPATVGMLAISTPSATATTKGTEVEPVVQTLERLKLATFYTDQLLQDCQISSAQALSKKLSASQVKGNSLLQLSYRAPSAAVAEVCVSAVVAQLAKSQVAIAAPLIKTLEEQLAMTQRQLSEAASFQAQLEKRAVTTADGASLLMLNALSKREDVVRLQKLIIDQKVQLSSPLTQPLQLLEPVFVPESAVFPKALPVLAGGLLGGLALGGLAFFVRRSWLTRNA